MIKKYVFLFLVSLFSATKTYCETMSVVGQKVHFDGHRRLYTTETPVQTGYARRSEPIAIAGLYNITEAIPFRDSEGNLDLSDVTEVKNSNAQTIGFHKQGQNFSIYNAGVKLPLYKLGNNWYTFVQPVDDFYTNRNYVWAGDLTIQNLASTPITLSNQTQETNWLGNNGYNAVVNANGEMTRIYKKDESLYLNLALSGANGTPWNGKKITTTQNYDIPLDTPKVNMNKNAKLILSTYDSDNHSSELRTIEVKINDTHTINCHLNSIGQFLFEAEFPSAVLNRATNARITVTPLDGFKVYPDIFELYVPVLEEGEQDDEGYKLEPAKVNTDLPNSEYGALPPHLNIKVAEEYSGTIRLYNANIAVNMGNKVGKESLIGSKNDSNIFTIPGTFKSIHVTSGPVRGSSSPLTFDEEKELRAVNTNQKDYVAIIPSDYNYFQQLRQTKLPGEDDFSDYTLAPWQNNSSYISSDLYKIWHELKDTTDIDEDGDTTEPKIQAVHEIAGVSPIYVTIEQIIDVYGGGIYGPHGIINFLNQNPHLRNVLLVSSTSPDYKKNSPVKYHVQTPGVPTGYFYSSQGGFTSSDDIYCNWNKLDKVIARLPVYTESDLTSWLKKRIDYKAPDTFSLLAGENEGASFSEKQLKHHGDKLPTIMLDDVNEAITDDNSSTTPYTGADKMNGKIINSNITGITNSIYQGHGASEFLDNYKVLKSIDYKDDNNGESNNFGITKPGCFVWATCNTGRFFMASYHNAKYSAYYAPLCYQYIAGKLASETGDNITAPGDHRKGAVNIIAASSLAGASWEANFANKIVHKISTDESITWGEVYEYAKKYTTYDQNNKMYHFFGDPSVQVRGEKPRSAKLGTNSSYKNSISLTLKGDWENNIPEAYLNRINISYHASESGDLDPIYVTTLSDEQKAELINGGTELDIDISSVSELFNVTMKVYTKINPEDSGGTLNDEQLLWSKHTFNVDRTGPNSPLILRPTWDEARAHSGVGIIDSQIYCEGSTAGDSGSEIAGYRFTLTSDKTGKVFESNSIDSLLAIPEYYFKAEDFPEMNYGRYDLHFFAYDTLGNSSVTKTTIFWRNSASFDSDLDNDSISDMWEEIYFGSTELSSGGNQDSDGDGISDYDEFTNGTHPYEFDLDLQIGWNMISLPNEIDETKLHEMMSYVESISIYTPTNQTYDTVAKSTIDSIWDSKGDVINQVNLDFLKSKLQPLTGFWAFCVNIPVEPIKFSGIYSIKTVTVKPGWNLVGPAARYLYNSKSTMQNANEWNHGAQDYAPLNNGDFLLPATGYWIFNSTTEDEDLILK